MAAVTILVFRLLNSSNRKLLFFSLLNRSGRHFLKGCIERRFELATVNICVAKRALRLCVIFEFGTVWMTPITRLTYMSTL